jgi:replicative DNA helicase
MVSPKSNKKTPAQLPDMGGMVPPHDLAMEAAVLGAVLMEKGAFERVSHLITESHFYNPENQVIYSAIQKVRAEGLPSDLLTVMSKLRELGQLEGAGGAYNLAQLTNAVSSSANLEYHARLLAQLMASREIIRVGSEMMSRGYASQGDGLDALGWAQSCLQDLAGGIFKKDASSYAMAWKHTAEILDKPSPPGVLTGLVDLDSKSGKLEPGDLTILAARPGMGKTVLGLEIAQGAAKMGKNVLFFSLEMAQDQLMQRLMSKATGIPLSRIRSRSLHHDEAELLISQDPEEMSLWIDDTPQITPMEMAGKASTLKAKQGSLDLVVVDYLQIMRGNGMGYNNREAEVSSISRDLKAFAKRERVHVIALAQLSRETEKRSNPQPRLSDLRESGAIEQDADNIWFLYRPEYYAELSPESHEVIEIGSTGISVPMRGHATVICEKFRQGSPFRAYIRADLSRMSFFNGPEGYGQRQLQYNAANYPDLFENSTESESSSWLQIPNINNK